MNSNYSKVRASIPSQVRLIAVSKTQSAEAVFELYQQGHRDFGENYVQELVAKAEELEKLGASEIRWHFVGHLQTNKVKALASLAPVVHTVDSLRLGEEISKRWVGKVPVYVEVNVDNEVGKSGVHPENALELVEELSKLEALELQGLMCIPKAGNLDDARDAFQCLKGLSKKMGKLTRGRLSMGMSQDYLVAIKEGATDVRVGTAIFGVR